MLNIWIVCCWIKRTILASCIYLQMSCQIHILLLEEGHFLVVGCVLFNCSCLGFSPLVRWSLLIDSTAAKLHRLTSVSRLCCSTELGLKLVANRGQESDARWRCAGARVLSVCVPARADGQPWWKLNSVVTNPYTHFTHAGFVRERDLRVERWEPSIVMNWRSHKGLGFYCLFILCWNEFLRENSVNMPKSPRNCRYSQI